MRYTQLTQEERYQIYALLKAGHSRTDIAVILNCHKSTIRRERSRNTGLRGYRPLQAQRLALERGQNKVQPRISESAWSQVEHLLRQDWGPEQISLWLNAEHRIAASHEWIYQYILQDKAHGGEFYHHLRCQKQRRKRYGSTHQRGQLVDRISIDDRPAIVDTRSRIGDGELDTIIGKGHQQAIVSLTERKSRYTLIHKVTRKTAQCVSDAIIRLLSPLVSRVITLTSDNGKSLLIIRRLPQR